MCTIFVVVVVLFKKLFYSDIRHNKK